MQSCASQQSLAQLLIFSWGLLANLCCWPAYSGYAASLSTVLEAFFWTLSLGIPQILPGFLNLVPEVAWSQKKLMVPKSLSPTQLLLKLSDLKSHHSSKSRLTHLLSENVQEVFSYKWGLVSGSLSLTLHHLGTLMSTTPGMLTWEYTGLVFMNTRRSTSACPGWHYLPLGGKTGLLSSGRRPLVPTVMYNLQLSSINSKCAL